MRARGLKHLDVFGISIGSKSRPMRARGLKQYGLSDAKNGVVAVAPHAGAWIETASPYPDLLSAYVAPHAGAWIETR